jgi:type II secretory pathway pseudopilin PulG
MTLHSQIRRRQSEQGYVMMTLLLAMALMIIFAAAIVPSITFDIKRDREEEMIHRGVQYSRAIRAYYKKFSRYPAKLEDLENTSQQRFLRKRYKDPVTGKEFRLLHYGEAKLAVSGMGGGMIPGASTIGPNGSLANNSGLSQPSQFGSNGGFGTNSHSNFSENSQTTQTVTGDTAQPGSDPTQAGSQQTSGTTATNQNSPNGTSSSSDKPANTPFGGSALPIVGVASLSKDPTIREFDKKKKYNEWQFVYDPTMDRGLLITTPYQQQLQGFGMQAAPNLNGQLNGQGAGQNNNGVGNAFGNSPSPMQNNPMPNNGGYGNPNPINSPPEQK